MWLRNNFINYIIENPFKTWWKARKYFKRPTISVSIHRVSKIRGYPYASYNALGKILDIDIQDILWKDKFDSPRYERGPLIYICLFRCIALSISFHIYYLSEFGEKQNGDSEYWEYLLNWLYYKKRKTLKCYSTWVGDSKLYKKVEYGNAEDGSEDTFTPFNYIIPCVSLSLNKRGIKKLKQELNLITNY